MATERSKMANRRNRAQTLRYLRQIEEGKARPRIVESGVSNIPVTVARAAATIVKHLSKQSKSSSSKSVTKKPTVKEMITKEEQQRKIAANIRSESRQRTIAREKKAKEAQKRARETETKRQTTQARAYSGMKKKPYWEGGKGDSFKRGTV